MSRIRSYLAYLVLRVALCALQSVRMETYTGVIPWLVWLCADVLKLRRSVVEESLQIAYPEASAEQRQILARGMWEHLFVLVAEVAMAGRKIHETNWNRYLRVINLRPALKAIMSDRPTLIVSGHFGNFELANYILGMLSVPTLAVARELDNPYIDHYLRNFRANTGQRMVDKKGGYDDIRATLDSAGTVSLLADQYAGSKGCWVDFFGRPASTHKAIALLALDHQATLVVAFARRRGAPLHYDLICKATSSPLDQGEEWSSVRSLTQWYTARIEEAIRTAPQQYWWVHRRWKDNRPAKRKGVGSRD